MLSVKLLAFAGNIVLVLLLSLLDAHAQGLPGQKAVPDGDNIYACGAHGYPLVRGDNDAERMHNWRKLEKRLTGLSEKEIVAALGPAHITADGTSITYQLCRTRRAPGQKRGLGAKILTIEMHDGRARSFEIESAHWSN